MIEQSTRVISLCRYPRKELVNKMAEVYNQLARAYTIDLYRTDDTVAVNGTMQSQHDFMERLYYTVAHSLINDNIEVKPFFHTVNPVVQPDLSNNRFYIRDGVASHEINSPLINVHIEHNSGLAYQSYLHYGSYTLTQVTGSGYLDLRQDAATERNYIEVVHDLPTFEQFKAYLLWYNMESL